MNAVIVIAMDVKWVDVDEKQLKNIIQNISMIYFKRSKLISYSCFFLFHYFDYFSLVAKVIRPYKKEILW
jgi:hypothetical protein